MRTDSEVLRIYSHLTGESGISIRHRPGDEIESILNDCRGVAEADSDEAAAEHIRWWGCFEHPSEYVTLARRFRQIYRTGVERIEVLEPPEGYVQVRVAVAVRSDGEWCGFGASRLGEVPHPERIGPGEARFCLTATLPIPTVTEVEARVAS